MPKWIGSCREGKSLSAWARAGFHREADGDEAIALSGSPVSVEGIDNGAVSSLSKVEESLKTDYSGLDADV